MGRGRAAGCAGEDRLGGRVRRRLAQLDLDRGRVFACVQQIAGSWRNPPGMPADVMDRLERDGLVKTAAAPRSGF
ncbi:hypothetical protein G3I32_39400 [Streptomyces coelicoflavus]|uniref:VapC50 C-terminal domain-containing protein n=1 Tax=Streptomyces coelicoflavus TaxID=285562 RepID=A0A7K3PZZ0_9ACTN|nr:hypothetical protein [Streptomyces coelicoflavus]NEB14821.1 hypothetical protein [Streptomyces coelicoflavus]